MIYDHADRSLFTIISYSLQGCSKIIHKLELECMFFLVEAVKCFPKGPQPKAYFMFSELSLVVDILEYIGYIVKTNAAAV